MKSTLAITAVIFTLGVTTLPIVWSDNDEYFNEQYNEKYISKNKLKNINPLYNEECGSCHMAYPPGLLPATSWKKILTGLEDHFGDNAELDNESLQTINSYLLANSADNSTYKLSRKIMRHIDLANVPVRISETTYFKHEHNEIPERMVTGNSKVNSFSHCNTCHTKAERALFNEHDVRIPGYGEWDD